MVRYAALLRGVNVGGITVKSAELGALFRELGFEGVKTVLASGNVLFETPDAPAPDAAAPDAAAPDATDPHAPAPDATDPDAAAPVAAEPDAAGPDAAGPDAALKARIEKGLGERFGYDAWIVLVEHADLEGIVAGYPYPEVDDRQPYVLFASDASALAEVVARAAELDPAVAERADPGHGVLYWEVPRGSSTDTPFSKFLAKPRFKATTTTRNLRTLRKLL